MNKHAKQRGGSRGYGKRNIDMRKMRDKFLIVCEGEKTEPNYFNCFPISTESVVVSVIGTGMNTISLVEKAIDLKTPEHNQVWCVFDRDSFPAENFTKAIALAKRHGIQVAYSNEAFELWYLLHFIYCDAGISRELYIDKLKGLVTNGYTKNSEDMYSKLLIYQSDACKNAKRLFESYNSSEFVKNNPSTNVYLLVEELNKFIP